MAEPVLGLILAGGRARRMGGADKGLLPLGGRPLLAHAIERLAPQCDRLALNANGDPARFASFGLDVLADDVPGFPGPLAGVLAGLEAAAPAWHVVSLPADTPFAPPDLVARLTAAVRRGEGRVAIAASGGRLHPTVALWPAALAGALRHALEAEGLRRVEDFARRAGAAIVEWPDAPFDPFFNVNTPDDLARAEALLAGASGRGG